MHEKYKLQLNNIMEKPIELDVSKYNTILNDDFINIYNKFSREEKRTFWRNIIDKIKIDSNKEMKLFF